MYPRSKQAAALIRQSHSPVSALDVLHGGKPVARLLFTAGSINAEGGRTVTRNFTGTVIDPTGGMDGSDIDDLLSPYDCEVAPKRGVLLSDGSVELAPQGVFQLTNRAVTDPGSISVTGQDRAIIYQGGMDNTLAISGATPVETAIRKLLVTRNKALQMHTWVTGFTCGPLLFTPDINVWDEALSLAKSVGGFLYHDREGNLVFDQSLPTSGDPVATYSYSDGVLLDASRSEDTDTIRNVVVVESAKAGVAGLVRAVAEDTDPTSPTYAGIRRRVMTVTNQYVASVAQAQQMARAELVRELGRSETATPVIIPDPFLDPNDVIMLDYPQKGLIKRALTIASFTLPLGVGGGGMSLDCRKSLIAADGRVIDDGSGIGNE
jgi:hypothetical protein